jgi:hypothetical protein
MLPGMGWIEVIKQSLDIRRALQRPARSSRHSSYPLTRTVDPRELGFTNNALNKMSQWHLSEADVKDVFYHGGVVVKQNMMVKKYSGYEIGLYFFQDKQTGQFVISSVWKRDRY